MPFGALMLSTPYVLPINGKMTQKRRLPEKGTALVLSLPSTNFLPLFNDIREWKSPSPMWEAGVGFLLELRTSSNESLTSLVCCVLAEVLDEACSKVLSLLLPLCSVSVCVAWVEDSRIYVWQ